MQQTSWLAFSIDRSAKIPVFEQICAAIRGRVVSGGLTEGTALPATRVFATELGVSRSTVVTAYEQLVAEGYLRSRQGSGYAVCTISETEPNPSPVPSIRPAEDTALPPIPFEIGQPDTRLFPHRQWAKSVARVCRTNPEAMLAGGTSFGNPALRQAIAAHVAEWRGIDAAPHQVIVTAGSADALEICMSVLAEAGDQIGLESPGYLPARHFAKMRGLKSVYMQIDDQGAELPLGTPKFVVLTPSHQYPLGGAMSPGRRLEFIQCAESTGAWIVEDDYDSEFRYAGRPIPALAGFDRMNRTIYVGSFSKIFSNALRLGYLIVPDILLDRFRAAIKRSGVKASYMPQQALAEFMTSGEFYRHLRRVRRVYGERRKHLVDQLSREFAMFGTFEDHQAGMHIAFHLNDGLSDKTIACRASDAGIAVQPLSALSGKPYSMNGLALGFCGYTEDEADSALEKLKTCITKSVG
ncbi:PLP-dependent aminotransferase family protein [Ruegeria sp. A3M17]|uniref:MocR-like pyridoxine biosynthesis transcription factor PdxR n=1 Tax=Ruegeria sp. A3M17 TaxID=2267229 RepID=UPI000DE8AE38|nr:PLP-dependent aminotransferase family protein [Ruegeria sp. A3M17]RBW52565.1 PLP-dependent aminotransferase family protein [Ruegeria sp. A3M17]